MGPSSTLGSEKGGKAPATLGTQTKRFPLESLPGFLEGELCLCVIVSPPRSFLVEGPLRKS